MLVVTEPSRGDIARALVGSVCAFIVMALLYEPTVRLVVPKVLLFTAITVVCVVTARSKGLVGPTVSPPGLPMGWLQVAVKVTAGDCACELKSPNVEPIGERLSTIEPTAPRIRA